MMLLSCAFSFLRTLGQVSPKTLPGPIQEGRQLLQQFRNACDLHGKAEVAGPSSSQDQWFVNRRRQVPVTPESKAIRGAFSWRREGSFCERRDESVPSSWNGRRAKLPSRRETIPGGSQLVLNGS